MTKRRCRAMLTSGERQCRNAPLLGAAVCRFHGGAAPQVRRAARLRLAELVEPAVEVLHHAL